MERGHTIQVLDHGYVKLVDYMGSDEAIIESARMSTNKGFVNWEEDYSLLEYLYANAHLTPFESGGEMAIEVQAPIMVFREWHRHRTQCLTADTEIYFSMPKDGDKYKPPVYKMTIKELFEAWQANPERIMKMELCCFNEDKKIFETTQIIDVVKSGYKPIWKIVLEDNKVLRASKYHRIFTDMGWLRLHEVIKKQANIICQNISNVFEGEYEIDYRARKIKTVDILKEAQTYDIAVSGPFHNFVAQGMVVHNSYNELSARYTQMPNIHYVPAPDRVKKQSKSNKQGTSNEAINLGSVEVFLDTVAEHQTLVYGAYEEALIEGIARETARINTPVSRYSRMRAKTDLRNWLGFLNLRMRSNAQYEIRQYANAVASLIKEIWPKTYSLFEEYDLYAVKLSRREVEIVRGVLEGVVNIENDVDALKNVIKKLGK
jgi:Predicted alternative thymidylate synthase